jgi:hypothetical protein
MGRRPFAHRAAARVARRHGLNLHWQVARRFPLPVVFAHQPAWETAVDHDPRGSMAVGEWVASNERRCA